MFTATVYLDIIIIHVRSYIDPSPKNLALPGLPCKTCMTLSLNPYIFISHQLYPAGRGQGIEFDFASG